jgi:hypothetical protein
MRIVLITGWFEQTESAMSDTDETTDEVTEEDTEGNIALRDKADVAFREKA